MKPSLQYDGYNWRHGPRTLSEKQALKFLQRVKPMCTSKLYRCIKIIFTDLLLGVPSLHFEGNFWYVGERRISLKSALLCFKHGWKVRKSQGRDCKKKGFSYKV